jgi:glutamate-ammonia-ligase adenylyltransferase
MRELRVSPTCDALRRLAAAGRVDPATASDLVDDYRFLRRLEHRLQMVDDRQTHALPADRAGIAGIAAFLGYPQTDAFVADLLAHLSSVERHYAALFEQAPSLAGPGNLVFTGVEDDPETLDTLARLGFAEPAAAAALVRGWHHGRLARCQSAGTREPDRLCPSCFASLAQHRSRSGAAAIRPICRVWPLVAALFPISRQPGIGARG